jgi:Mn2+/Fe2+ NRAMP family transporter
MPTTDARHKHIETRSGLDPWATAKLPKAPYARGLKIFSVIGPGAIVLGASIGSGEWLLGPATFIKYGLTLLWLTTVAVFFQTILNTELIRYTLYTGEPALTGFMRTRPNATFWAWFYALLFMLQVGWPAWAATAAGAVFYLFAARLAGPADASVVYWIGCGTFVVCVAILVFSGKRIERTLEILNWIMITVILGALFIFCLIFAAPDRWLSALVALVGYDLQAQHFAFFPQNLDWLLIGAFVGYSGAGGASNLMVSNWTRDKGYGMGQVVGFIPSAVSGQKVKLAHSGSVFQVTRESFRTWLAWWRIVRYDQWGVFFLGGLVGMALPAILYTSLLPQGKDIRNLGIAAELANSVSARSGRVMSLALATMSVWVLFKTQLDILEGTTRSMTDMLWSGSRRIRKWRGGDVRLIYYTILVAAVIWGLIALRLTQPIVLLQLSANVAGLVMVISSIHILYVNTKLLPRELKPPMWRRASLIGMAVFYAFFVYLWLMGGLVPDRSKGFLFSLWR